MPSIPNERGVMAAPSRRDQVALHVDGGVTLSRIGSRPASRRYLGRSQTQGRPRDCRRFVLAHIRGYVWGHIVKLPRRKFLHLAAAAAALAAMSRVAAAQGYPSRPVRLGGRLAPPRPAPHPPRPLRARAFAGRRPPTS